MHYGKVSECTDLKVDRDDNTAKVTVKGVGDVWRLGFHEQSMHDIARPCVFEHLSMHISFGLLRLANSGFV